MAELVSSVLEQLASIPHQQVEQKVRVVVGVDEEVKKLISNFQAIEAALDDADNSQVMENVVREWLDKLTDLSYDVEDVLDEWNTVIQKLKINEIKVFPLNLASCFCFRQVVLHHDIALKIKKMNEELDVITMEKDELHFSLIKSEKERERQVDISVIDVSEVHGRDQQKNRIVELLLSESSQESTIPTIPIVGMEGIGKTTLARLVFNDNMVQTHFDKKIWVCISHLFDVIKIAKAILDSQIGVATNLVELNIMLQQICHSIEGKKFLLVLDDVWFEDSKIWEQLKHSLSYSSQGSRILLTTCKEKVANIMRTSNMITLDTLPDEACWSLFSQLAFYGRNNEECKKFQDIGRKIVGKCKGVPFAVKILGSLLCYKSGLEDWKMVLDSDIWKLKEKEKLFLPLLLSYYDLPSVLRKCFLYCLIFPKGCEIDKDRLIKLWIAQDYLKIAQNINAELIGEKYFEILAIRSFFQDFKKDHLDGSIIGGQVHNLVYDFAQFLTKKEYCTLEIVDPRDSKLEALKDARHSMIMLEKNIQFPISIFNGRRLRSLIVECRGSFMNGVVLSKLFDQLTSLRTLDLSNPIAPQKNSIKELPRGIGKLIHLRYLNLSKNTEIVVLPETLYDLYNLQILDITSCWSLQKLPQGLGRLINLKHLINSKTHSLGHIPRGIERLTCLQTLRVFVVSGHRRNEACSLECLKNLNRIQGSLFIKGLGNVVDVHEAKRVELKKKENVICLGLNFKGRMNKDDLVLEALEPPTSLKRLGIYDYKGKTLFPSWMMTLTKLSILRLDGCLYCEHLPPFGKLPSLESLFIWNMESVQRVGNEFLGIEGDSTSSIISFPRLKSLDFWMLERWEEWDYDITRRKEDDITIMPCLRSLTIRSCCKLKALPDHLLHSTMLEELRIYDCDFLDKRYRKGMGEDWFKISRIPSIKIADHFMPYLSHCEQQD